MNLSFSPVISTEGEQLSNVMLCVPVCPTVALTTHAPSLFGLNNDQPEGIFVLLSKPSIKGSDAGAVVVTLKLLTAWSLVVFPSVELFGLLVTLVKVCAPAVVVTEFKITFVDAPVASDPVQDFEALVCAST